MAEQVTNYQCPNCSAGLRFDEMTGQVVCDSCDSSFDIAVIEQVYTDRKRHAATTDAQPEWDISMTGSYSTQEAAHLRSYSCPSCGAGIICDETTAATSCPYCGNPAVIPGQFEGGLKPDCIIPFRLDKNAAVKTLKSYYEGKRLLPDAFADDNHIDEIKGIYVPFWLFDGQANAVMHFKGTVVKSYIRGNYKITETDHYRVMRAGSIVFEKVPVDGSKKMPDAHMDSIEPFEYHDLQPFSTAYLPGFLADIYDEDAQECTRRANDRIIASTEKLFRETVTGYATLTREHSDIRLQGGQVRYALLPVWLLSTKWNGENYLFAMNGQTGKLIGDLPVDRGKYWRWFATIAAPIAAVLSVLLFFF